MKKKELIIRKAIKLLKKNVNLVLASWISTKKNIVIEQQVVPLS